MWRSVFVNLRNTGNLHNWVKETQCAVWRSIFVNLRNTNHFENWIREGIGQEGVYVERVVERVGIRREWLRLSTALGSGPQWV